MHCLIIPIMLLLGFSLYACSRSMVDCPEGQIFIPRGIGGACVVGSWR